MAKLIGFCEMKKREGKILFVIDENTGEHIVGYSADKVFVYGEISKKIERSWIGKELDFKWEKGYGNKAILVDVNTK